MRKDSSKISMADGLYFSTFNYYGLGSVLPAVAQAFWINFSSYYLNNLIPDYGNIVFLVSQLVEALGILLGWILLKKLCQQDPNYHMRIYIFGAVLLMIFLPLIFIPELCYPWVIFFLACTFKVGSGLMLISQLTIIPKITSNRSRRRKLVEKNTQFGLGGTFAAMFVMTLFSNYVSFVWKYFIGVVFFVLLGGFCSLLYSHKIQDILLAGCESEKQVNWGENLEKQNIKCSSQQDPTKGQLEDKKSFLDMEKLKSIQFYIYGLVLSLCSLYIDIIMAMYPYFIKSFHHISQIRYLSAIVVLYLSSFVCSLLTRNSFVYTETRIMMSVGLATSTLATVFFILGFVEVEFGVLIFVGTCLTGVSKVIASNCALNIINEYIGKNNASKEFIYGCYYFLEKVLTGLVLYKLINSVYRGEDQILLHFSWIYLPFILYATSWVLVIIDRSIKARKLSNANCQLIDEKGKLVCSNVGKN